LLETVELREISQQR